MLAIGVEFYIILGAVAILFIIVMFIIPKIKFNNAKKILRKYPNFKEYKKELYDFTIENDEIRLYIRMIDVPSNSMITINSKDTWCLSYGGSSSNPGRAYPNKKYLDELKPYLKKEIKSDKLFYKVILVNNKTEKVVRYLNESELAVVNYNEKIYDYQLMEMDKIEEQLKNLGIIE